MKYRGQCTKLTWLNLGVTKLEGVGSIPKGEIRHCTVLSMLLLGDNNSHRPIPTEIGDLTNLERLAILQNSVTLGTIPKSDMGHCTKLIQLNLDSNSLKVDSFQVKSVHLLQILSPMLTLLKIM